jgi:hemolysin activation/secretion protein
MVRNLTGQGDMLEASIQRSAQSSGKRGSLAWYMPLGYYGTQFSFAFDQGRSTVIEEPINSLDIQSSLNSRDVGLSQSLIETLTHKLAIGLNHVNRENRTTLMGRPFSFVRGEPNGQTTETLWRFWQEYAYRSEAQVLAFRSTFTSGTNNIQNVAGLPATNTPQRQYQTWLGQVQYARQVTESDAQIVLRGTTQRTSNKLLPLDGISIGGVNSVRGYRENQLIRDNGEFINIEFEYPLVRNEGQGLRMQLIPFVDIGRGQNIDELATTISSMGLASRVQWYGFSLDIALAKRLSQPESIKSDGSNCQDKGVHFQLAYSY